MNLNAGTIVDERYEVLSLLGEGGMGLVYKARELELGRTVALKLLHGPLTGDQDSMLRFEREARIIAALSHKHIMTFYRIGNWQSIPYIATEYLEGESLANVLAASETLSWKRAASIVAQIAEAMEYAHKHGIIHRDLKPNNIMLVADPEPDYVKVLDFGLARSSGGSAQQKLTQTGALVGSVFYMSPEQCTGRPVDNRSDIYALGCIFYEVLTGKPPFTADNPIGLLHLHATARTPLVTQASCSQTQRDSINAIITMSMEKDPLERYQTMDELHTDLQLLLQGQKPERADLPSSAPKVLLPVKKMVAVLFASFALVILATAVLLSLSDTAYGAVIAALLKTWNSPQAIDWGLGESTRLTDSRRFRAAALTLDAVGDLCSRLSPQSPEALAVLVQRAQLEEASDNPGLAREHYMKIPRALANFHKHQMETTNKVSVSSREEACAGLCFERLGKLCGRILPGPALHELIDIYRKSGRRQLAEKAALTLYNGFMLQDGPDSLEVGEFAADFASLEADLRKPEQAEKYLQIASRAAQMPDADRERAARTLLKIAEAEIALGHRQHFIKSAEDCASACAHCDSNSMDAAIYMQKLAIMYEGLELYDKAELVLLENIKRCNAAGNRHSWSNSVLALAKIYSQANQSQKARELLKSVLSNKMVHDDDYFSLVLSQANLLTHAGKYAEAESELANVLAGPVSDTDVYFVAMHELCELMCTQSHHDVALAWAEKAKKAADDNIYREKPAPALWHQATTRLDLASVNKLTAKDQRPELRDAITHLKKQPAHQAFHSTDSKLAGALLELANEEFWANNSTDTSKLLSEALGLCRSNKKLWQTQIDVLVLRGWQLYLKGDKQAADDSFQQALNLADQRGKPVDKAHILISEAWIANQTNDLQTCRQKLQECAKLPANSVDQQTKCLLYAKLATADGNSEKAGRLFGELVADRRYKSHTFGAQVDLAYARFLMQNGFSQKALAYAVLGYSKCKSLYGEKSPATKEAKAQVDKISAEKPD